MRSGRFRRAALAAVLLACGTAWGEEAPVLKDVRWQILPADIREVTVGRDGRAWYTKGDAAAASDVAAAKKEIEEQWKGASPVLHGTRPVLFEKTGRVWFEVQDQGTLLAYDGTQWVERAAQPNGKFIGEAPTHGHMTSAQLNADTGKAQVFMESGGVSVFEAGEWTFQSRGTSNRVLLSDATGNDVVLVELNAAKAWRYETGKWIEVAVPAGVGANIQSAALQPGGVLLLRGAGNGVVRVPLEAPAAAGVELEKQFNTYLNKIDNHDPEVAEAAAQGIADMGPAVVPLVNKVLENIVDADAERRLRGALAQLSGKGPQAFKVAGMDVGTMNPVLYSDGSGNVYVSVSGLPAEVAPGGVGTYVIRPGGKFTLVPGTFRYGLTMSSPAPQMAADGKLLWLPTNVNNGGITRVDLTAEAAGKSAPVRLANPDFWFIHDVLPDGTLIVGMRFPTPATPATEVLAAFKPGAAEDRVVVKAVSAPAGDAMPVLSGEGILWAGLPGNGLARFDGKEWTTREADYAVGHLFAGKQGELLVWQGNPTTGTRGRSAAAPPGYAFIGKDGTMTGTTLEEVIQSNPTGVASAFASPIEPWAFRKSVGKWSYGISPWDFSSDAGYSVAVDLEKRLWVTHDRQLRVMSKGGWVAADWPPEAGPSLVIPVAGGAAMYVWEARGLPGRGGPQTEPKAHLAKLEDGKVQLQPAPWTSLAPFADAEGNLWVMRAVQAAAGRGRSGSIGTAGATPMTRPLTVDRLGAAGLVDSFEIDGLPLLLDASGYVWIAGAGDEMQLWKERKVAARVKVPYIGVGGKLFCDKPGSVWAWTIAGLQHFVAAEGSAEYAAKGMYAVESEEGNLFRITAGEAGVSAKGFLYSVLTDPSDVRRLRRKVYTVELPKE